MTAAWKTWPLPESKTSLEEWQAGRCAWCGYTTRLVRDHCHDVGIIRGLLCSGCNTAEGFGGSEWDAWRSGDNPARAMNHLETYRDIYGRIGIGPLSPLNHYTPDELTAWSVQAVAEWNAGGWPTAPWLKTADERRTQQMREAMQKLSDLLLPNGWPA